MPIKQVADDVFELTIFLTPGAARECIGKEVCDEKGNKMLKASVFSHAEDNKANKALIKLLAKHLGIAKSGIEIKSGCKSRRKVLLVHISSSRIKNTDFLSDFGAPNARSLLSTTS